MRDKQCNKNGIWIAVRRHKAVIVAVGIPFTAVLLVVLLVLGLKLKWEVIDPTYWPHQEKTVYSFNNKYSDNGGVFVAVCTESSDVQVTVRDDKGRRVDWSQGKAHLQVTVPAESTYTFVAKNMTDHWIHANVHECDTYN